MEPVFVRVTMTVALNWSPETVGSEIFRLESVKEV